MLHLQDHYNSSHLHLTIRFLRAANWKRERKKLAMKRQMYNPHEVASQKPLKVEKTMFTQKVLEEQKQIREEMIKKEEDKKE